MSAQNKQDKGDSKLAPSTLLIASLSSAAAAIFINEFWTGGAILGAMITPIIVTITGELLKKPTQAAATLRQERLSRTRVTQRTGRAAPPPAGPELERPDPFGIWQADRRPWYDRLKGRPLKAALATGVLAFVIGGFVLTGADLVLGGVSGGGGGGGDRFTIVPGTQDKKPASGEERSTETTQRTETTDQATQPAPEQTTETAPPETTETVPTAPSETVPPEQEQPPARTPPPAQTVPGGGTATVPGG